MVPVGQTYIPSGAFSFRGLLTALILGGWAAAICAGLICLWEISPIPTLVFLTPIAQGVGVSLALAFVIAKMKIRNAKAAGAIGLACGLLCVILQHCGHYAHFVYQTRDALRAQVLDDFKTPAPIRQSVREGLTNRPFHSVDEMVLIPETGSRGLLGSLKWRAQAGVTIKGGAVTGGGVWALWGFEALIVVLAASVLAAGVALTPFCEDCHRWCEKRPGAGGELAGDLADPLAIALRDDDPAIVRTLKGSPPDGLVPGATHVTLMGCPSCDLTFADVDHKVPQKKGVNNIKKASRVRISPEMADALQAAPGPITLDESDMLDDGGREA